jgi:2-amino-4-hydroxy-6-hydroxymethyldihydropteridine diphosphokinase
MPKAYLSLGSNIGNREAYLKAAVKIIKTHSSIKVTKVSGLYQSEPVGYALQRLFLNIVIEIETSLSPRELLMVCQFIEEFLKRKRKVEWGPRTIDVDILLYGQEEIKQPGLTIPHPEMSKRIFVLVPLLEIVPHITFPNGNPVRSFLDFLSLEGIERVGNLEI